LYAEKNNLSLAQTGHCPPPPLPPASKQTFLTKLFHVTLLFAHNCPVIGDTGKESCPDVMFSYVFYTNRIEFQDITAHLQLQEKYVNLCHFWTNLH
jgi:hypothetical protein